MPWDRENSSITDPAEFLREARERFQFGRQVDETDRLEAEDDNRFANASDKSKEQWDPDKRKTRKDARRPVLQWNRIKTSVTQVVNNGRQNRTSIRVAAKDGGDPKTAEYTQSRIRHVEYEANADTARDTARSQQVCSGRGFIRYSTEYVPGSVRKQRICIEPLDNQFSVVWDPAAKKYDRSDADWCFVIEYVSKAQHERMFGPESILGSIDFEQGSKMAPGWIGVGTNNRLIQIAQYWCKEYRPRTRVELITGEEKWEDECDEHELNLVIGSREDQDCTVKIYVINGLEILDETESLIPEICIVPYWGETETVDNVRRTYSLIRNSKDPQRALNLQVSNLMEELGKTAKAPWRAVAGSIPKHLEEGWDTSGADPKQIAYYLGRDPDTGEPYAPPTREVSEPPIQGLVMAINQSIDAIKAGMGIFDSSLGAAKAEYSGVSVEKRTQQADITNFHFADNEVRSRRREGDILIKYLAVIDQPGSNVPIREEDGKTSVIPVGTPHKDQKTGEQVAYSPNAEDYMPVVYSGPSYASARRELAERDAQIFQALPETFWVFGDQWLAADDTPGSQERAERVKRAIQQKNPGLIQDASQPQIPPEVQAQIQQLSQKLQVTQAFAQSLHEKLQVKQPELDVRVEIAKMQEETKRVLGLAKIDQEDALTKLKEELNIIHRKLDRRHELNLKGMDIAQAQANQPAAEPQPQGAGVS